MTLLPTPVTEAEVHRAAIELSEAGQRINKEAVRDLLGRGSFTTITAGLKTWRARQQAREALEEVALPEALTRLSVELNARLWLAARELADAGMAELRRRLEAEQDERARDEADHGRLLARLQSELAAGAEREAGLHGRLEEVLRTSQTAEADLRQQLADERDNARLLRQRADQDAATITELREKLAAAESKLAEMPRPAPSRALSRPSRPDVVGPPTRAEAGS